MFKPGDLALVVKEGYTTKVVATLVGKTKFNVPCPVQTDHGIFDESELLQAHPTVLATAEARQRDFVSETKKRRKERKTLDPELWLKLYSLLEKAELDVDLNGHWKNGSDLYDPKGFSKRLVEDAAFGVMSMKEKDAVDLIDALENGTKLGRWVTVGRGMSSNTCSYCGTSRLPNETDGKTLRLGGEPCAVPEGFTPNEWELNVPSGKIVVANDLRSWFPLPDGDSDFNINTTLGCRQTTSAYAEVGMSHAFVGNTCPGVFSLGGDKYKIANGPAEDYWDDKAKEWKNYDPPPKFDGERVAGVCTDLWWYSLCDLEELQRRFKKFGGNLDNAGGEVIDVKPGVYRFRHDDEVDRDAPGETLYAEFEWIRDPDPVKDLLESYEEVEVNAHAYVQLQTRRWPTLYGGADCLNEKETTVAWADMTEEQRVSSWRAVADHIFFTIGGGTDWHEKGFPAAKVDPNVPDIEPPEFRQQYSWYPFSKGYGGIFGGVNLAPSFARLAFRCLESVISFGMAVRDDHHSRGVPHVRKRMLDAVKKYRKMAKKYPEVADPDYVWWLKQKGRAEAWVERFDLGPTFTQKHQDNIDSQRWVPEDAYAIEFDARKIEHGHFAGKHGWAHKDSATGFAIEEWSDNEQEDPRMNCFWASHAIRTAIPLYSVARVVKLGEVSHMGHTLIELAFDYGTDWMQNPKARKAINEHELKDAVRVLTKEEYEELLPKAKAFKVEKKKKKAK